MFTKVKCQDGAIERADLSEMEFIPNGMFSEIQKLLAKKGDETVEIFNNSSYHTQRSHMSKTQSEEFKYPCIDNVNTKHEAGKVYWSNIKNKGHFGVSKIIMGSFGINTLLDKNGEYGLTQHGIGIVDTVENLKRIEEVLNNEEFQNLNKMTDVAGTKDVPLNHKAIALFRKDFWKEFMY